MRSRIPFTCPSIPAAKGVPIAARSPDAGSGRAGSWGRRRWRAGGSPNSSASRYSSEICCSAATTRFQDASSAAESGAGGGGAGREHPDVTRRATSSRSPVRFIRGRDYRASGLLRRRLQTESLEDLGRLLLDDLLVLRPHPEEVLLHRPERLEMGVLELVDGTRLHDLDRTFHERRADEPAEGLPGEVVDVPLRVA